MLHLEDIAQHHAGVLFPGLQGIVYLRVHHLDVIPEEISGQELCNQEQTVEQEIAEKDSVWKRIFGG